jgi:hypothetical protein
MLMGEEDLWADIRRARLEWRKARRGLDMLASLGLVGLLRLFMRRGGGDGGDEM